MTASLADVVARAVTLPNFIIAGTPKSGSSTLHYYLDKHPDVFMSREKEPGFFLSEWNGGEEHFRFCFGEWSGQSAIGEATVGYFARPESPALIRSTVPRVKLVFALRNPISRTHSHHWHRIKSDYEDRTFDQVLASGPSETIIEYSRYATHVRRFLEHFPLSQMHFVLMDDLKRDLAGTLEQLFRFLEVDSSVKIEDEGAKNTATLPLSRTLDRAMRTTRTTFNRFMPQWLRRPAGKAYLALKKYNTRPFVPPPLSLDQTAYLTSILGPEIDELESIIGRDLSMWRRS